MELEFSRNHPTRSKIESNRQGALDLESWESVGPFNVGGRTRAVAIDVSDPSENTIIAGGVSGGIWKSTDGGESWRRTSNPEFINSITAIAQDTRAGKEHIWYYGTGELVGNSARGGSAPFRGDGIFKSTDGGESWFPLASTQDANQDEFGSQFQYTWKILLDPTDLENDVVYLASFGGILRSIDGGDSWDVVLGETLNNFVGSVNLNAVSAPFYTEIAQSRSGFFYAYLSKATPLAGDVYGSAGVYYSADGVTWSQAPEASTAAGLERGVLSIGNSCIYFFVNRGVLGTDGTSNFPSLFKADIGLDGQIQGDWQNLTQNLPSFEELGVLEVQGGYNMMIKQMPSNENVVLLGATNLYRSKDGFNSTTNTDWIGGYNPDEDGASTYPNHHPDQHDLLFFNNNPNKVLSANDGGLHISNNILASPVQWISKNNGFRTSQFYTIDIPKSTNTPIITGGLQDNGSQLTQTPGETSNWTQVLGGDGGFSASVPQQLHWYFSFQNSQIYRITFGEESSTYARIDPIGGPEETGSQYLFINPFVLDPVNPNIMYLAGGNTIWKNSNLGQIQDGSQEKTGVNWKLIEDSQTDLGTISALEVTANSEYLYYGTSDGGLYKIPNPSKRNPDPTLNIVGPDSPTQSYVSCIAANPDDADEILVVYSNYGSESIFFSENAGEGYVNVGGNLEGFSQSGPSIRWAEIVPLTNGTRYFVGTSVGLYSTDLLDGSSTIWLKESPETIGKSVIRMMDYRPVDGRLVVATHGNGVFASNVSGFKELSPISPAAPENFKIAKAFPNPFNGVTEIEFEIPETNYVRVDIYDTGGNFVKTLFYNVQFTGNSSVTWDGTNQHGFRVPRGMYFYNVYYGSNVETGRLVYSP